MAHRKELGFWQVPVDLFQKFNMGEMVNTSIPVSWGLKVGDSFDYDAGDGIFGEAQVFSIGDVPVDAVDSDSKIVPGVACSILKIK